MKILIVSDTHGHQENLEKVIELEKPFDMLIHLGDIESNETYITHLAACHTEIVAGNNDFFSYLDREKIIEIGKYKVFITHGHKYYVAAGTDTIKEEAIKRGADIVMFGHTHIPEIDIDYNIIAINPGSLTYPRQKERVPTYIIMEIDLKGKTHFTLKSL